MSCMLDTKESVDRFSDDDSDGLSHSSDSPTPSGSSSICSSSPLLRRPPAAGFITLHSEASEHSLQDWSPDQAEPCEEIAAAVAEPTQNASLDMRPTSPPSPEASYTISASIEDDEDDLPDWLREHIVLPSATSIAETSACRLQPIENEIRLAVDSASIRVQQELGRREQFESELLSAAMYSETQPAGNYLSATTEVSSINGSDCENGLHVSDDEFGVREEKGAETEGKETLQSEQAAVDKWIHDSEFEHLVNSSCYPSADVPVAEEADIVIEPASLQPTAEPDDSSTLQQTLERENDREYNYNNLMARYGHYSHHSGKVNPEGSATHRSASVASSSSHNTQAKEYVRAERSSAFSAAPALTSMTHTSRSSDSKKKANLADMPAYERLYALAKSKDKWIQRAQKAKEIEQTRDEERMRQVELMAAKSREIVANRSNGSYAHIGDRFHGEALSDMAKKVQRHEVRVAEREQQQDWMCPKCAKRNQYSDSQCQNIIALAGPKLKAYQSKSVASTNIGRREFALSANYPLGYSSSSAILCGQPKPERLFKPTLLTTSSSVMKAVNANKQKALQMANSRRQRHRRTIEKEFQQTCPFRPTINNVSEEIVREKLEIAAAAASAHGKTRPQRSAYLELYENSFHARALREEREAEYFKQFPFKPDIGVNALWVAPEKSQTDFVERLAVDKYHELERKRAALYDKYASERDPDTGKELFKPEIGRAPVFSRNMQGLPIGDFLHGAHREQQEYHRRLQEKSQREIKKKSQQTFVSETSRQALERRKADICSRIFNELLALSRQPASQCSAASGPRAASCPGMSELETDKISREMERNEHSEIVVPNQVDLAALPVEISRVIAIVFEFASHEPISRDAFSGYMDRLVREVPGITYSQIVFLAEHLHPERDGRHRHCFDSEREAALAAAEEKELTFHPTIDKNSREIATKNGRVSSANVFQALNQYYDHYLERKEQLRKQRQHEFKKSHPFHPTLVTKAHQREPAAAAFYDKICTATTCVSSAPVSHQSMGTSVPPTSPLQTANSNARPCVRPIESDRNRSMTQKASDRAQLHNASEEVLQSSSTSQLVEDAELAFRALAALDVKSSTTSMSPTTQALIVYNNFSAKVSSVRSPEDSKI